MHRKRAPVWFLAAALIVVGLITASLGQTARVSAQAGATNTSTPFPAAHVVISEFRSRGPQGENDEFVELFNPSGAPVFIGNWSIRRSVDCGGAVTSPLAVIASSVVLKAGEHYLLKSNFQSSLGNADQSFHPNLTDSGGIGIFDDDGNMIDAVGMCNTTQFREGTNLQPLLENKDQSYERLPGGLTACYDTGNNEADFSNISPATPLNRSAPITLCAGVMTYTPTRTPTLTPTRTPTRTATTIPGFVIINEFLPHPHSDWNEDGQINVNDEFIELINLSPAPVNIRNWKLDNGAGTKSFVLPDMSMLPRQILVFFRFETGIPLSDGGGTVRLTKSDGRTADLFNYPPVEAMDKTWCRIFSGTGFLTFACDPTPGRPNVVANPTPAATPTLSETPAVNPCILPDTAPSGIVSVECDGAGGGIGQLPTSNPFLLMTGGKWPLVIQ
jgi:hypothetical protein